MFERLEQIAARYEELGREMASDEVVNDHESYQKVAKQHRDLEPIVDNFRDYQRIKHGIADAQGHAGRDRPGHSRHGAG